TAGCGCAAVWSGTAPSTESHRRDLHRLVDSGNGRIACIWRTPAEPTVHLAHANAPEPPARVCAHRIQPLRWTAFALHRDCSGVPCEPLLFLHTVQGDPPWRLPPRALRASTTP